ncbi:nucleoside triphosphate pyrophosphohydrolase family protein [Leptotrichia shahii]|jgi:Phosphoribosyl-ATP pyrophosphohydrolase.|uniref:nucleoside triphosphate pyrophosphohydrolase family protein n=1 Tax=Leptotrichia shahii TaxID=157691 RepID=UPI001CABB0D5|nr:nucleoside triphosphate pyrophosphohydrolase family protein [Leptotrichia shahii]MBF0989032.1 nucleoside triphosphate pyrophosphohydrolase family protein [Clostridiales bacterium]
MEQWNKLVKLVKEFYIAFGQQEFLEKEMTDERMKLREKLFEEELKEYDDAEKNKDKVEMLDAVCDMCYILIGTLLEMHKGDVDTVTDVIYFGEDDKSKFIFEKVFKNEFNDIFVKAFEEVHRSNMSKLENGKAVFRKDGKILKGANYFRPNLKQFIE